jgi:hypothetical protein
LTLRTAGGLGSRERRGKFEREYFFHFAQAPVTGALAKSHDRCFAGTALIADLPRVELQKICGI